MKLIAFSAALALIALWLSRRIAIGRRLVPTMADDIRTAQRLYDQEYRAEEQRRRQAWIR